MAFLQTIFCGISGAISPFLGEVVGEKFTNCKDFNDNMHTLEVDLEALRSKASDIETEVENVEILGKKKRKDEVRNWLEDVAKLKNDFEEIKETGFCKPLMLGSHVKKLIQRVGDLRCQTFNGLLIDGERSGMRSSTKTLHGKTLMGESDKILSWLKAEEPEQVSCIGICGMGGVGKTTLAEDVCKRLQDNSGDVHIYRLNVSKDVDINKLQKDLAKKLDLLDDLKDDDAEDRARVLNRKLMKEKNVVLLLDDVWDRFDLSEIGIPLGEDGCKVIITSRLWNVCNQMGCNNKYIVKVEPLSKEEAWELFLEKLNCTEKLSPEVEGVAKIMAAKCDGLPLAIITLAISMRGEDDLDEWEEVLEQSSIEHKDLKNEVFPILQISYNRLMDSKFQQCFLYCSLYPEDYEIPRDELIAQLIYEGVIDQKASRAAEFRQGRTIIKSLVKACLLESVINYRKEECVKMHDLLREMAVEILKNNPKFMTKAGLRLQELPNEKEWEEHLEKVFLMRNKISEIPKGSSPRCPRLSTLILGSNPLKLIPDSFFAHMHGLRVLNLKSTNIKKLPDSISELENLTTLLLGGCRELCHVPSLRKLKALLELDMSRTKIEQVPDGMVHGLRVLNLKSTNIKKLPDSISELENLTALLLGGCRQLCHVPSLRKLKEILELDMSGTKIEQVPDGLAYMLKLKCLKMDETKTLMEFPKGILPQIFHLECLLLPFHLKIQVEEVEKLEKLEEFRGWVDNLSSSKWLNKSPPFNCINIIAGDGVLGKPSYCLLPRRSHWIYLYKYKGLSDCLLDTIPSMYLEVCVIGDCDEIESILRISTNSTSNNMGALLNIEKLRLHVLKNFVGFSKWEPRARAAFPPHGTFSFLKELLVVGCPKIKKLFPHKLVVHNLQNLEKIEVCHCVQMEEIIADERVGVGSTSNIYTIAFPKLKIIEFTALRKLDNICNGEIICCDSIERIRIRDCPKLKRLPFFHPCSVDEKPTISFPNLKELELCNLPEVKSICNGIMICDSIRDVDIRKCKQLSRLPLYLELIGGQPSPPPKLKKIGIAEDEKEWWESLEWDHPNSNNVLSPFLQYVNQFYFFG